MPSISIIRIQKHFPESKTLPRIQNTSQNPKTRPRIQNTFQNPKTRPRIQNTSQNPKHFPESEHTSQKPKHVPESRYQKYTLYSSSFIARIQGGLFFGLISSGITFRKCAKHFCNHAGKPLFPKLCYRLRFHFFTLY